MKTDADGATFSEKLTCTKVEELLWYKSYLSFGNPQFISKDKIAFEGWNPLRFSSAECIYIYNLKDGKPIGKPYEVYECQKTDNIFELEVIEENVFCIFSDKKMRVYSSEREQPLLIQEQTFDKSRIEKLRHKFKSEIIAVEEIKKAGYVMQYNYLYYDRSSKNIGKVECFDKRVFKLTTKLLKDAYESLVVSIPGIYESEYYDQNTLYFYYSTQENLNSYKTLTDINASDGDKVMHKNNFFLRMNADTKDLMCGIATP